MESSRDIEERAGEWLAKREGGSFTAEDEARLTQWLDSSMANRVAFLRQEAAWEHALRLEALRGQTPSGAVPSPDSWRLAPFVSDGSVHAPASDRAVSRKRWTVGAVAAVLVLAVAASITWVASTRGPYYQTPVGGLASVPMPDGSRVTLNTDSAIRLAITAQERRVQLERGEAFFEVAKDPGRPFIVSAGSKHVTAVGTTFSVRRVGDDVRVFVTEGKVRFEDDSLGTTATQAAKPTEPPLLLVAGTVTRAEGAGVIVQDKPLTEVDDYLSWRSGYLTFRDIPLTEAIAEFNRYNEQKIFIQDPAISAMRFSGKVRPTSFEGFVRLLEHAFPIRAEHVDGRIVLTDATK